MRNKNKNKNKASSYGVEVTPWTLNPIPPVRSRVRAILFKLDGAEEACWAHNPKVTGSKPVLAKIKNYNITNYIQTANPKMSLFRPNQGYRTLRLSSSVGRAPGF